MGEIVSVLSASGEGHQPLSSSSPLVVDYIETYVTSLPPRTRKIGDGTLPYGIYHVGQVGLGWFTDDGSANAIDVLSEFYFVHFVNQNVVFRGSSHGPVFFGSVWWRLLAGVVMDIHVLDNS